MQLSYILLMIGLCTVNMAAQTDSPAPSPAVPAKQAIQTIRELGKRDDRSLPALVPYLSDLDRDVRFEAVKAIIKIDTMRSLDPLLIAIKDGDGDIQSRAIDGLVNAYVPGYVPRDSVTGAVTKGVRKVASIFADRNDTVVDPDVRVRADVAAALSVKITDGYGMDVRANAALAAGILRAGAAVPALEQGLRSKNSDVIFECLIALQKIRDTTAGPSVTFLSHDLDERVQVTALQTLGALRSVTSADDIRSAFKNARNVKVQRAALDALALLALPADRPLFQQNAGSSDAELRANALEGLGRIRNPEDFPQLQEAFNDDHADWRVHSAAAFAMVMEGNNSVEDLSPLQLLVEGFSLRQRSTTSAVYLSEVVRNPDSRAGLEKILGDTLKERKVGILNALAGINSADSIRTIQGYTADRDRDIASAALRALRLAQNSTNPQ